MIAPAKEPFGHTCVASRMLPHGKRQAPEWFANCTCGYAGELTTNERAAMAEASAHEVDARFGRLA